MRESLKIILQAIQYKIENVRKSIPFKLSQLENDKGYLTEIPDEYITETELEEKGYLTEHQDISGKADVEHTHTISEITDYETPMQADWNQNDAESKAHVLNRTHYSEMVKATVLEETQMSNIAGKVITSVEDSSITSNAYLYETGNGNILLADTYNVTLDGVLYENVPATIRIHEAEQNKFIAIGEFLDEAFATDDKSRIGFSSIAFVPDFTSYPFGILLDARNINARITITNTYVYMETNEHTSISIVANMENVVQLDEKYIPDTIARTEKIEEVKAYADNAANEVKNDLLNGAGEAYDTLKELGELIDDNKDALDALEEIAVGKADAEHIHSYNDLTDVPNIPTKVSELENDAGYLTEVPEQVQADWNQNDETALSFIKDRTHYTYENPEVVLEEIELSFDTEYGNATAYGLSDYVEFIEGNKYIVVYDNKEYDCICEVDTIQSQLRISMPEETYYYRLGAPILNAFDGNVSEVDFSEYPFSVYSTTLSGFGGGTSVTRVAISVENINTTHTFEVKELVEAVHKLDEKFIPYSIARAADIPTKVSELENDSNYATEEYVDTAIENKADKMTSEEAVALLAEVGIVDAIIDENGDILVNENGDYVVL